MHTSIRFNNNKKKIHGQFYFYCAGKNPFRLSNYKKKQK